MYLTGSDTGEINTLHLYSGIHENSKTFHYTNDINYFLMKAQVNTVYVGSFHCDFH